VIRAVILAAGLSSRMGRSKALLDAGNGETFLGRIVRALNAAGITDVSVVVGHDRDVMSEAIRRDRLPVGIVVNDRYMDGQQSSVLAALDAIDRPGVTAMMLTLVDVPLVSSATVRAVVDRYQETRAPIVRPVRGHDHGHPIVIDRSLFEALRHSDPATGIKPIVRAHVSPAGDVETSDEGAFVDVDTPERYAQLFGRRLER
jgi:molybdenum cofactor cytidylyltransferase